jgi:predicted nucleotidyltransferase
LAASPTALDAPSNDSEQASQRVPLLEREAPGENGLFTKVLGEATRVLENRGIPYALIGGVASSGFGRPRTTHDIDIFVKPADADAALDALAAAGYSTEKTDPKWIYKAFKHGVQVDVIFLTVGGIYFDEEMHEHSVEGEFDGQRVRFISPEDLLVIKAAVHDEPTPRHWHDALGLVAARDLDWNYLVRRSRRAQRRVLSLLIYAQSLDLAVPNGVIRELIRRVYD